MPPAERLRRSDRLLRSRDFQRVARRGSRVVGREFVLLVAPARCPTGSSRRLGITASRKLGNAVARNRVKRGVREWFRRHRELFEADVEVVVIARPAAAALRGGELASSLDRLAARCG